MTESIYHYLLESRMEEIVEGVVAKPQDYNN